MATDIAGGNLGFNPRAIARQVKNSERENRSRAEAEKKRNRVVARKRNGTKFLNLAAELMKRPTAPRKRAEMRIDRALTILVNAKVVGDEPRLYEIPVGARMTWFAGPKKELTVSWDAVCLQFTADGAGLKLTCPSGYAETNRAIRHDTVGIRLRASAVSRE